MLPSALRVLLHQPTYRIHAMARYVFYAIKHIEIPDLCPFVADPFCQSVDMVGSALLYRRVKTGFALQYLLAKLFVARLYCLDGI